MRYLVDNQLPPALAKALAWKGVDAVHVLDLGWGQTPDMTIWTQAREQSWIVVSKDEDFIHLANRPGDTGRVLWIRLGNCRRDWLLDKVLEAWPAVEQAFLAGQRVVELR